MENNTTNSAGKDIAIISYITFVGLIIAFVMNNDKKTEFGKYHIRQSLGINLVGLVGYFLIGYIPFGGCFAWPIISLGLFILAVLGIVNAMNSKAEPVPIFGNYFADWFKNI